MTTETTAPAPRTAQDAIDDLAALFVMAEEVTNLVSSYTNVDFEVEVLLEIADAARFVQGTTPSYRPWTCLQRAQAQLAIRIEGDVGDRIAAIVARGMAS